MRPATTFDEIELEQPVLHFFRALALKQTLRVRFAANGEQLDLRALEIVAFVSEPDRVAS